MFEHDLMSSENSGNKDTISSTETKKPVNLSSLADKAHKNMKNGGSQPAEDVSAMKAYSLAVAQSAENNEPDEPVTYAETEAENKEKNGEDGEAQDVELSQGLGDTSLVQVKGGLGGLIDDTLASIDEDSTIGDTADNQ